MGCQGIPFGFDTYGTSLGGCVVGKDYVDESTGYVYTFCQAHTDFTNDTSAIGEGVVQQSATSWGVGTNKASVGLDTTYPIGIGVFVAIVPESTATVTYYFWALKKGYTATMLNDGDDQAPGDSLFPGAHDPVSFGRLQGNQTNTADGVLARICGTAATTVTGTNSTAFVDFKR